MADSGRVRIEAAAAATGLTTRNIRAYQSLGLLPAPVLDGRVGRYGAPHLQRLRAVGRLRGAGFSLAAIKALFDAYDRDEDLGTVLGLRRPTGQLGPGAARRRVEPSLRLALVPEPLAAGLSASGR